MTNVIKQSYYNLFIFISITILSCSKESTSDLENTNIVKDDTITVDSEFEDMLTPAYYLTTSNTSFKNQLNQFITKAEQTLFSHPLGAEEERPNFVVKSKFGDEKGAGSAIQYHPAVDMYVGNLVTNVYLYAAHEGIVTTARDVEKYRQYIAITKEIKDDNNVLIGKLVTLYAHIDLDLDAPETLFEEGDFISKGTLISKNLYANTVGGPHLHFEVRYYRATDIGNEEFYGASNSIFTQASEGYWQYGFWNPNVGYGFANPKNHELFLY